MSLTFLRGDIFSSKAQALVNPVNCVGVMGAGLAKEFKHRWPEMFYRYRAICFGGLPGYQLCHPQIDKGQEPWIVNFPTKNHWRRDSRIEEVQLGLINLALSIPIWEVESLAVPALGCGNGGLKWPAVKSLMQIHLGGLEIPIEIYEP